MKIAIDMLPRGLSKSEYSHNGMWPHLRANQLKHGDGIEAKVLSGVGLDSDWSEYDVVYLYHSMDFNPKEPVLNIFGGLSEENAKYFERLIWPQHKNVKFVSLDFPMPDYGALGGSRCNYKKPRTDEQKLQSKYWDSIDWKAVSDKCKSIDRWVLDPGVGLHSKLTIGDSHSASVYTPKSLILRKDGRTLAGVLKKSIKKEVTDFGYDWNKITDLTCYWGNIDVRHHLCRDAAILTDVLDNVQGLAYKYLCELEKYPDKNFELVCLLPIEDESRKLPGTGYYKGTPFCGPREWRQAAVSLFNDLIQCYAAKNGYKVFTWPSDWYKMDGIEFMKTVMEKPRSVHLSRKYYRWDLENDIANPLLNSTPTSPKGLLEF